MSGKLHASARVIIEAGGKIFFRGNWEGRSYEDKGKILATEEEQEHSSSNWRMVLEGLKKTVESGAT